MEKLYNRVLMLNNDFIVEIDFTNKIVLNFLKANRLLAHNISLEEFCTLFCKEEKLISKTKEKFRLFFKNLFPNNETFSFISSFENEEGNTVRYEIKGGFQDEILTIVFSNINNATLDSLDSTTKVFTRESVIEKTKIQIENKQPFALVILDIDNFKQFNDTYGHMFGDIILVETAAVIKKILGPNDFIGRIGGDEFLMVIHTPNNLFEEVHKVCSNIKRAIQELSSNNIKQASVTATLGCSIFPADGESYDLLFKKADRALYRGKKKGRNCFVIYTLEKCGEVDELSFKKSFSDIETNDKVTSNSQIIVAAFEILTRNNAIKKNLEELIDLVGNFFSIERIHLEITNLEKEKKSYIDWIDSQQSMYSDLIKPINENRSLWLEQFDQTGMIKINQVKMQEKTPFIVSLLSEQAKSLLCFRLTFKNKEIGFIRFDTISNHKFWQAPDVSTLMVIAKIIGITINNS